MVQFIELIYNVANYSRIIMNKFIFCLLLLPILLVGVCAVSASSDLDADVPVIGSEHPAFVASDSDLPALVGHVPPVAEISPISPSTNRPILEGNFTDDNMSIPIVPIIIIDYDSNNQGSDRPSMDISVAKDNSLDTIRPQYSSESIVEDSNMEVFPYFPFGPHSAPATEPSVNFESGV